jgi:methylglyoxal synthase
MNIALMAHDGRKELMVQFCIAYCGILAGHSVCATSSTGRLVSEATGLKITRYMSCRQGGYQQIAARAAYDELDLVIFFEDPKEEHGYEEVETIGRICDQHSIPFATNIATAEVLIRGLKDGYLDWRDIVKPKK